MIGPCWGQQIVVLDAGHGGKSPGATSGKVYEKTINLSVAMLVEQQLSKIAPNIKVIQTRRDDRDITLYERADLANRNKADLFVSIHTNANPSSSANGIETYVMGVDKSGANLSVAMRENAVVELEQDYQKRYEGYDPNSPESFIIFSLMQSAYLEQSLHFADIVQKNYAKNTNLKSRGVKQAGFLVLWRSTMPSVLTEIGFISNSSDREYITTKSGQEAIAVSLANAIVTFLENSSQKDKVVIETTNKKVKNEVSNNAETIVNSGSSSTVYYSVQVKTSSAKIAINPSNFGQWVSVTKEFYSQNMYKYAIGEMFSYKDALTLQSKLKSKYKDCFVVAYRGSVRITLKEAQQILK